MITWFQAFWIWAEASGPGPMPEPWILRVGELLTKWLSKNQERAEEVAQSSRYPDAFLLAIKEWLGGRLPSEGHAAVVAILLAKKFGWKFAILTKFVSNRVWFVVLEPPDNIPRLVELGVVAIEKSGSGHEANICLINVEPIDNAASRIADVAPKAMSSLMHNKHFLHLLSWAWHPPQPWRTAFWLLWATFAGVFVWLMCSDEFDQALAAYVVIGPLALFLWLFVWNLRELLRARRAAGVLYELMRRQSFALIAIDNEGWHVGGGCYGLATVASMLRSLEGPAVLCPDKVVSRSALWRAFFRGGDAHWDRIVIEGSLGDVPGLVFSVQRLEDKIAFVKSKGIFRLMLVPNQPEAHPRDRTKGCKIQVCHTMEQAVLAISGFLQGFWWRVSGKIAMVVAVVLTCLTGLPAVYHSFCDPPADILLSHGLFHGVNIAGRVSFGFYKVAFSGLKASDWKADVIWDEATAGTAHKPSHPDVTPTTVADDRQFVVQFEVPAVPARQSDGALLVVYPLRHIFWRSLPEKPQFKVPLSLLRQNLGKTGDGSVARPVPAR